MRVECAWNVCELCKSVPLHGRVTFYLSVEKMDSSSEGRPLEHGASL